MLPGWVHVSKYGIALPSCIYSIISLLLVQVLVFFMWEEGINTKPQIYWNNKKKCKYTTGKQTIKRQVR